MVEFHLGREGVHEEGGHDDHGRSTLPVGAADEGWAVAHGGVDCSGGWYERQEAAHDAVHCGGRGCFP